MYPAYKISRSLGDLIPHQIGVVSEPSFYVHTLKSSYDKYFVLASEGLWDFMSSEDVIETLNKNNAAAEENGEEKAVTTNVA